MSAQTKHKPMDLERVEQIQQTSLEMMTAMHRGLSEIAKYPASSPVEYLMRGVAKTTLLEVETIAAGLEVRNA